MLEVLSQKITRRTIQIALGVLWCVDGALQLQHRMFTAAFANQVIAPAAEGQPRFISGVMHFFIHILLLQPFVCNAIIALIQLGIGVLLIWKRTVKFGITGSIVWGLFVWYAGEGLGGLAGGQTMLLMGAPGAALLYAIIACGVVPKSGGGKDTAQPAVWLAYVWAILWLGGALLQLVAGQNTTADVAAMISGMSSGAPGWLAALDRHTANALYEQGNWVIALLVAGQAVIGFFVLVPRRTRAAAIGAGIILSLVFWAIGQSFGAYYSGLATDPNTAPLVILLGLAILGAPQMKLEII